MSVKGSVSYEDASINCFNVEANLQVRVQALNIHVARLYLTDDNGNPKSPVHRNVQLRNRDGINIAPYNNEFLILWTDSYIFSVGGVDKLWLSHQRYEQAFEAAAGITHFIV
eukprot:Colp12_sorted_trinity150504_noHs@7586